MTRSTVLFIAAVAFIAPISVVAFQQREAIQERTRLEPWQGQLLYFTSPT